MFRFPLILLLFLGLSGFLNAQTPVTITSCPDTVWVNSSVPCHAFYVTGKNATSTSIQVAVIDTAINQLAGTDQMVAFNGCAAPVPGQPESLLVEGNDQFQAQFVYFPNGQTGTSVVNICFFDLLSSSDTVCETITLITSPIVSVENLFEKENLEVYPNPFVSELNIRYESKIETYALLDAQGKVIFTGKFREKIELPATLKQGPYFLHFYLSDGRVLSRKVVKN